MRQTIIAAGLGLFVSMTAVAAPDDYSPEAKAYFNFSFGGARSTPSQLQYGLKLDHDRFFAPEGKPLPPLMQLDLTRRGMKALSVNGVNVLRPAYRVNQDEEFEEEEYEEEEEGFFGSIGSWFAGIFGDDEEGEDDADEDSAETETAETTEEDDEGYDAIDWGLLAIGLVGIGYVTAEIIDGDEDPDPRPMGITEEGAACILGETLPLCLPACAPDDLPGIGGLCFPAPLGPGLEPRSISSFFVQAKESPEHREWLDSGTGQMGDLYR